MTKFKNRLLGCVLAGLMAAPIAFGAGEAFAQAAAVGLVSNGTPVDITNQDLVVGGPVASQIQAARKVATPTYTSGGCTTTPALIGNPYAFQVTNGASACSGSVMAFTLPAAPNKWVCNAKDLTSPTTTMVEESISTATLVTFTNYTRTTGVVLTWVASDVIVVNCTPF